MAKVSTLFDEFTGGSLNLSTWTPSSSTGPTVQITVSGGNLTLGATPGHSTVTSVANYDWTNSELVVEHVSGDFHIGVSSTIVFDRIGSNLWFDNSSPYSSINLTYNATTMKYFKFVCTTTTTSLYYSANNFNWTLIGTHTTTVPTTYPVRLEGFDYSGAAVFGAVNPVANTPPTVALTSPADLAVVTSTLPVLSFAGTDADSNPVTYQVQVSQDGTFTSTHTDALSTAGTGFSGTDPYTSGASVNYTLQTPITMGGILYYWRVRAKDPLGTNGWGAWTTYSFTTEPLAPQVTTISSSNIAITTATASGNVTSGGGGTITERGIVYGTSANPTTAGSKVTALGTTGAYNANLTGLTASTIYHYRAYAINSTATSYGADLNLTTLPVVPTISSISNIDWDEADVNVSISAAGSAITERGIVYSTISNPTISDSKVIDPGSGTTFTATPTSLVGNTLYYVRAYASNSQGTTYSTQSSFTTLQQESTPTVLTGTLGSITTNSATVTGSEVTLDGTHTVTERGVVLSSTNNSPTIADTKVAAGSSGLGTYNVNLSSLSPEKLYYLRAYATNSLGTGYGPVVTFTTLALFIPDAGDGYWTWQPDGSDAKVARTQSTSANASANLMLADLNLEDGEDYTLYYSAATTDEGSLTMKLQWYDTLVKQQQVISPGVPYTFTYDKTKLSWAIRLFVTGASTEPDPINAVFSNMYLAKESTFSGFVPFVARGLTEIKLDNNWLLDKRRESTIESIFDVIYGLGWRQFESKTIGLGWLDIGDQFTIIDDTGENKVIVWDSKLTIDGGITENLSAESPEKTETDYKKAGSVSKSIKRTQISVDHNAQEIESIVEDVYSVNGVINTKFSQIEQDLDSITTTVQSSGGVNLVRNSVMYSFSDAGIPDFWELSGSGSIIIQASPESKSGGGISGNVFALNDKTASQRVSVRKDVDFVAEDDKLYYSFSARVKKNTVGVASITLSNRNETLVIELPDQQEYYWEEIRLERFLPLDDHYDITITSDSDANLQVTDVMLSPGKNSRQWSQANGEAMNTNVAITDDGMTIRSNVFRNDYTKIDALGFEVHKHEAGGERVFGFNGDETNVRRLRADYQISLAPIRMVPIDYGDYKGTAFTRTEDN